jgi:hypothetical protein
MDPALHLAGAEGLLALCREEARETGRVQAEEVLFQRLTHLENTSLAGKK